MFGGKVMDNFMDKLAHKLSSSEIIRANTSAEAKEMGKMKAQIEEYELLMQQMRQIHLRNVELLEKMGKSTEKIETILTEVETLTSDSIAKIDELNKNDGNSNTVQDKLDVLKETATANLTSIMEMIHSEDVKVYRNVQAIVNDGFESQQKDMAERNTKVIKKIKGVKPLVIVTMVFTILGFLLLAGFLTLVLINTPLLL